MFNFSKFVQQLVQHPHQALAGNIGNTNFIVSFVIPDYAKQVQQYYSDLLPDGLKACADRSGIPFYFNQFGLEIKFESATELDLHDADMNLDPGVRKLADQYGPVIFKNAYLSSDKRSMGHRNRFPHLSFHVDRSPMQPTPYSIFLP